MRDDDAAPSSLADGVATSAGRFLAGCVRALFSGNVPEATRLPAGLDGDELVFDAAAHGLLPLLGVLPLDDPHGILPPGARDRIRHAAGRAVLNHAAALNTLGRIGRSLSAAGIPYAVLKGPYLCETLYAGRFPRPYSDLDLLVPRERVGDAIKALLASGYRLRGSRLSRAFLRYLHFHVVLEPSEPGQPPVELHWALVDRFNLYRLPDREIMARLEKWNAGGSSFGALAPEDEFIYLCLHAAKHGSLNSLGLRHAFPSEWFCRIGTGNRLLWFTDIALFLKDKGDQIDWNRHARTLRLWNVRGDVIDTLRVVGRLIPESPALTVLARLGEETAEPRPREDTGLWARGLRGERGQRFLERANTTNPALLIRPVRLLTLGQLVFPSPARLLGYYRVERRWLLPFLYAWHPFHSFFRLFFGLSRIGAGR